VCVCVCVCVGRRTNAILLDVMCVCNTTRQCTLSINALTDVSVTYEFRQ